MRASRACMAVARRSPGCSVHHNKHILNGISLACNEAQPGGRVEVGGALNIGTAGAESRLRCIIQPRLPAKIPHPASETVEMLRR